VADKTFSVNLDDQHLFNGVVYGPGSVTVDNEDVAKALRASHDRVVKARGAGPVVRPNGIATGILQNTQGSLGANTFTPADAVNQRDASEAAANKQKDEEDASKKAAKERAG
jgi:hypothetical protein